MADAAVAAVADAAGVADVSGSECLVAEDSTMALGSMNLTALDSMDLMALDLMAADMMAVGSGAVSSSGHGVDACVESSVAALLLALLRGAA